MGKGNGSGKQLVPVGADEEQEIADLREALRADLVTLQWVVIEIMYMCLPKSEGLNRLEHVIEVGPFRGEKRYRAKELSFDHWDGVFDRLARVSRTCPCLKSVTLVFRRLVRLGVEELERLIVIIGDLAAQPPTELQAAKLEAAFREAGSYLQAIVSLFAPITDEEVYQGFNRFDTLCFLGFERTAGYEARLATVFERLAAIESPPEVVSTRAHPTQDAGSGVDRAVVPA